ncbi:hypothetical protein Caci_6451 [Catenulispora acidiphila DSM 44928]|uniref:Uncharacterized protein n=1 Tax=Catenulispora acidiphila (strain DSM 44928 / JCM 14897 / NBRC 102108 / NRRL B-24433 / ID139908) TaxID=479433 RepID=C7PWM3_CATAD|nr:hypothetical protein [Catenulispora acidiphila]ACU75303.1 hypothetical protein Caci_6451 [Catenulispora acidiphila DSM 44928]
MAKFLGIGLENLAELADVIVDDLDEVQKGIGWWSSYTDLGTKERGPADDFSPVRVTTHFCGALRALASALDCLGGCLVGVPGLPTDIVKAALSSARDQLTKAAKSNVRQAQLASDLNAITAAAGPAGWMEWLIAMRNTDVHRARRIMTWDIDIGAGNLVEGINMKLPRSPELTEIQACVYAGGTVPTHFEALADAFLDDLTESVVTYLDGAANLLKDLWVERKQTTALIEQPASQW